MDKYPLYKITWEDACGGDGWVTKEDLDSYTPIFHQSVGYLVKETDTFMTICMSHDVKGNEFGAWLLIPKSYIKKKKKL
jgi:hypothetical protein